MTADQSALLAHPMTIFIVGTICSIIGGMFTLLIFLLRDNSKLSQAVTGIHEILDRITKEQDIHRSAIDSIRSDFNTLKGIHDAINELGGHQKKTA